MLDFAIADNGSTLPQCECSAWDDGRICIGRLVVIHKCKRDLVGHARSQPLWALPETYAQVRLFNALRSTIALRCVVGPITMWGRYIFSAMRRPRGNSGSSVTVAATIGTVVFIAPNVRVLPRRAERVAARCR